MLALKLGMSIGGSNRPMGAWLPTDETSVVAWYQKGEGITLNGSDVSAWDDSANSYDMVQATSSEQPAYNASTGALTFVGQTLPTVSTNLQTAGQISLAGDFTIGIKLNPSVAVAGTFIADNTTTKEIFKINGATRIIVKIDLSAATYLDLDSGTFGDDYLVITRVSNVLTLWHNGTAQTGTTPTLSGTADIDALGIRYDDTDGFDGTISEVQIYSSSSASLTADVNNRLSNL